MGLLAQLWLPILLSAVFVFVASSILHMVIRAWHGPDYKGFANESEVGSAIRSGNAVRGMYMIPYCTPDAMKTPEAAEKFRNGPVALVYLRNPGTPNMGAFLGQWFAFCVVVAFLCALLAVHVLAPGADHRLVFHVVGLAAFLGHALGPVPNAIWWGQPWRSAIKHIIDGLIYAIITGLTFSWSWPG